MSEMYSILGISKQAFHQRYERHLLKEEEKQQLRSVLQQVRDDHPSMSAREIYYKVNPTFMGRDAFESYAFDLGFRVKKVKNYRKTTDSTGVIRFPNLIAGLELTGINQVWVSDITYYELGPVFKYITIIMDVYSRNILAAQLSSDLRTINTTLPALRVAIKVRKGVDLTGLIFHSDGGGQYYCKEFVSLTRANDIRNSMCEVVQDNSHAERVNGTIKNDYLYKYGPQTEEQLIRSLKKAVRLYNNDRPHSALGKLSPQQYELQLDDLAERKKMDIKQSWNSHFLKNKTNCSSEPVKGKPSSALA